MSHSASGGASRHPTNSAPVSHPSEPGHSPAAPYAPQSEVHLLDRLVVLYRHRWLCLTVFILVSGAMIIQGYTAVRMYRAQARLLIEDERSTAIPGMQSEQNTFYEDPEPYYQTQYRILRGRDLTRRVVQRLHLDTVPEFNGTAEQAPTPISLLRDFERRLAAIVRRAPAEPQEPPKLDETTDESALVGTFIGRVGVEPVRGSRLVDVTFLSIDRAFAAEAANALVEEYVQQNLQVKLRTAENMLDWLGKELAIQQQKVEESERSLAEYREKENALSLDDKQNIVLARLTQLNDAVTKAKTQRVQKESLYNQVKSIAGGAAPDSIPIIAQNPAVQALKSKLSSLQQDKVRLLERYGEKHPQVVAVNASLQDTQKQLEGETQRAVQSVRNEFETALLEERTLSQNLEAAKTEANDLNRKGIGYGVMEREAKSNRQVYEALLQREKELRVSSNSRANNVRIVDRAEVPGLPVTPGGRRTWLLSIVVGLVLAVGVAMGIEYMDDTIKTPEDVTKRLRVPFLGLIPSVRGNTQQPLLTSSREPAEFGESFRSLRTAILARYGDDSTGTRLMGVTSAQPLEGKTTTACNIAMALAAGGARVLIIDADMRRPGLHRTLRLANDRGLAQVLVGQARVRDVIQRTVDPNLLAITAGRLPSNPSELLSSERMKTLIANLRSGPFDWILIDTPPVLAVTDAVILAPLVNGIMFVIGAEMTRRRLAERGLELIMGARPRQTAVVLNKVDFAKNKYYYTRYHGHQYRNYYAEAAS